MADCIVLPSRAVTTDLAIPTSRDLEALSPKDRWDIEDALETAHVELSNINDEELRRWVADGKTQTWIAKQVRRDQSVVSRRCAALGLEPKSNRGRPRNMQTHNSDDEPELVEGEIVESPPPRQPHPDDGPAHYLPDVVAEDAEENLRTQALHWFEQGGYIKGLLQKKRPLEPRSPEDRKAIKRAATDMERIARQLKEMCK
jgi:hypothetical protein